MTTTVNINLQKFPSLHRTPDVTAIDTFMVSYNTQFAVILTRLSEIHNSNMDMLLNPTRFRERKAIEKALKYRDLVFGLASDNDILIKNLISLRGKILEVDSIKENRALLNAMSSQKLIRIQKLILSSNATAPEIVIINRIIGKLNALVDVFNSQGMFSYIEFSTRRQHQVDYEDSSIKSQNAKTFKRSINPNTETEQVLKNYVQLLRQIID